MAPFLGKACLILELEAKSGYLDSFVLGVIFLPSVQMVLTTMIVGQDPRYMRVGVANHEFPDWPTRCAMDNHTTCGADLSCRLLKKLTDDNEDFFDLVPVKSEAEAVAEVNLGKMWGYISFPANYSEYVSYRGAHGVYADEDTLEGSIVKVRLDMSRKSCVYLNSYESSGTLE